MTRKNPHPHIYLQAKSRKRTGLVHLIAYSKKPHKLLVRPVDLTEAEGCLDDPPGWRRAHRWCQDAYDRLSQAGPSTVMRLGEAVEILLTVNRRERRPKTLEGYGAVLGRVVAVMGEGYVLARMTKPQLVRLRDRISPPSLSRVTRDHYVNVLGVVLREWHAEGLLPLLPFEALSRYGVLRRGRLPDPDPVCWKPGQIADLLAFAGDQIVAGHEDCADLVRFLLLTGMRAGPETMGLRWDEYDPELRTLTIPKERAKNKKRRVLKLRVIPSVEDLLHDRPRDTELVWGGWTYRHVGQLFRALRPAVPGATAKTCRATCATYLHSSPGIALTTMQICLGQLGHSPTVAAKNYMGQIDEGLINPHADTLEQAFGIAEVSSAPGVIRLGVARG